MQRLERRNQLGQTTFTELFADFFPLAVHIFHRSLRRHILRKNLNLDFRYDFNFGELLTTGSTYH